MREVLFTLLTGHGAAPPLAAFAFVAACVFAIAAHLTRAVDAIATATGLGRLWGGTILLAAATSLPELTTGVDAALLNSPDIGVGDLFGSTLANMLLLALFDLLQRRHRIFEHASREQTFVAALSIALTAIAGASIASGGAGRIGSIGVAPLAIVGLYLLGMRMVHTNARMATRVPAPTPAHRTAMTGALVAFALAAFALLLATPLLVLCADAVSIESGLGETYVGTLLVGMTTSLPELAAMLAAVRLGAFDLAIGNVFGSNAFNVCILLAMDVAYTRGPLLAHVSRDHVLSAQLAVLVVALGLLGIVSRARHTGGVRIESVLIVLVYVCAAALLAP